MTKQRILVVDDDKDDQFFLLEALNELYPGFECDLADNGREALEHIDRNPPPPDYIFLDLNMPLLNGYEFLEAYCQQPESEKSKIIVYSTSSHPQDKITTKNLGATDYITKLSDFRKLKQVLEQLFGGQGHLTAPAT